VIAARFRSRNAWGSVVVALGLLACQSSDLRPATPTAASPASSLATRTPILATPTPVPVIATPTPVPARALSWIENGVLYLVHVGSFNDADGDGTGDLSGLKQKLDYLNDGDPSTTDDLGVSVLCLLPVFSATSAHGFDTLDHFAIRPEYGSRADLLDLVGDCHRRGMKVILQYVMGYVSDQQAFFQHAYDHEPSAYSEWFQWLDYPQTRYRALDGVPTLPLLNGASRGVQEYALRVARYWMDLDGDGNCGDGVDGYLCDRPSLLPASFWERLRAQCKGLRPDFVLAASLAPSADGAVASYQEPFDAVLDILLHSALTGSEKGSESSVLGGAGRSELIATALAQKAELYPQGALGIGYLSAPDSDRIMSVVHADMQRARLAATMLFTLPGVPMLYYGEEIGMAGERDTTQPFGSDYCREPMDWYAVEQGAGMPTWFRPDGRGNRAGDGVSVEEQTSDPGSLLNLYRRLIRMHGTHSALRLGSSERIALEEDRPYVGAYLRQDAEDRVLVVFNLDHTPTAATLLLGSAPIPSGVWNVVDLLGTRMCPAYSGGGYSLDLGAQEALVLGLERR